MKRCLTCGERFESQGWRCPACGWEPVQRDGFLLFAPGLADAEEGFIRSGFEGLARYEERNFWFRGRSDLIEWALARSFPSARTLLEVGCGTGYVLMRLHERRPDLDLTGGELYLEGLEFARKRLSSITLHQLDARRLPFSDEFDVVCAFDVIEHVDEDEEVLAQIHEATRRGGGVAVTVPQHPRLWSATDEVGKHRRRYTKAELVRKLQAAGLEPERVTSFVTLLLPVMAVSRLRDRRATDYDPLTELRVPRIANAVMKATLDAERLAIRAGISLPVGGSLLAVARRR